MSQRMTRSRKRAIEGNIETYGLAIDEFGCTIDEPKSSKPTKVKKNEDEDAWDCNYVVEVKRQKRDQSPESNPVYFRQVLTTATIHRSDAFLTPPPSTVDEEEELLHDENAEPNVTSGQELDIEDDTASDSTEKVVEDLKVLLEQTKGDDVLQNGLSPDPRAVTPIEKVGNDVTTIEQSNSKPIIPTKISLDYNQIDLLSSEPILENVESTNA